MVREVKYDELAAMDLAVICEKREQHAEVLQKRCSSLAVNAEEQWGVKKFHDDPEIYELIVRGEELEGLDFERYRIVFALSSTTVLIIRIDFVI